MNKIALLLASVLLPIVMVHAVEPKPVCKNTDGTLDITFGDHGKVVTLVSSQWSQAEGVAVLPSGRIVAVGNVNLIGSPSDFALVCYDTHGFLSKDFGTNGIVQTDFATVLTNALVPVAVNPSDDRASAVALQRPCSGCSYICTDYCGDNDDSDYKIVVVGYSDVLGTTAFAVARYNSDGTLDTSFGLNQSGVSVIPIGIRYDVAYAVALQADNKIVVAGFTINDANIGTDFAVIRLNCDGTLDTTFGCDATGKVIIKFGGADNIARAVKIQKNGKIVVAGWSNVSGSYDFALIRLTPEGILDTTFGINGKVLTPFVDNNMSDNQAHALVLVEDCGVCCASGGVTIIAAGLRHLKGTSSDDFGLAGYTENGDLDDNFGSQGLVVTHFPGSRSSFANAVVLQQDCAQGCKIVAGGLVENFIGNNPQPDFGLARYLFDGSLDASFGIDGMVTTDFFKGSRDTLSDIALQENGDIVAAGFTVVPNHGIQFALARYKGGNMCCARAGLSCVNCK